MQPEHKNLAAILQTLIGRKLTGVDFVQDYFQLRFGEQCLSVFNAAELSGGHSHAKFGEPLFKDELLRHIGYSASRIELVTGERLTITLNESTALAISLRDDDYRGPEALKFEDGTGTVWVT